MLDEGLQKHIKGFVMHSAQSSQWLEYEEYESTKKETPETRMD